MYDSHTHLCSDELKHDSERIISEFGANGGLGILNVGFDTESSFASVELTSKYVSREDPFVKTSIGLHPTLIGEHSHYSKPIGNLTSMSHMFEVIKSLLKRNKRYVTCIGETGLDYYHLKGDVEYTFEEINEIKQLQKQLFRDHINLAMEYELPLTIHTRDVEGSTECITNALEICAEVGMGNISGSFHSYTGDSSFTSDITGLGFCIGVNAIITYRSGANVRDMVSEVNLDNLLLESDAPYLPLRSKGKKVSTGEPSDIQYIAGEIATVKDLTKEMVIEGTSRNFERVFKV